MSRQSGGLGRIELQGTTLRHRTGKPALANVSMTVEPGERVAVLGASGSGKTSLLRVVAGLSRPTEGVVRLDGADAAEIPPSRRGVSMAFQQPAVYPHLSVARNLAFGHAATGVGRAESDRMVRATAERLHIETLLDRKPAQLSGGQVARVALGRALTRDCPIVLLDEPFSGLDAPLRVELRELVADLHGRRPRTILLVTHDPVDAAAFGERIAVMEEGRLVQFAPPEVVHDDPESLGVALAMGGAGMNRLEATFDPAAGLELVVPGSAGARPLRIPSPSFTARLPSGTRLVCLVGAEDVSPIEETSSPSSGAWEGTLLRLEGFGPSRTAVVDCDGVVLRADAGGAGHRARPGTRAAIRIDFERSLWFDADSGLRVR